MLKYLLLTLVSTLLISCFPSKYEKHIIDKGYDVKKDTLIVKPYEYYKKFKGFTPDFKECEAINPLKIKISIKGYENESSIPLSSVKDSIQFVLSDTSFTTIESGMLYHMGNGGGSWYKLKTGDIKNYKLGFLRKGVRFRAGQSLVFFCVQIRKGTEIFTIPARHYTLE